MGGADAKILMSLVLLIRDGRLLVPVLLVGGVQGLLALALKRKQIPYTLSIAGGVIVWLVLVSYQ